MNGTRILLGACALLLGGAPALAQDCKPVETAPGIKSVPAGCNKFMNKDVTGTIPKNSAPAARPSTLFPGAAPGSVTKFGDTEVRINGRVRFEAQMSR